MRTLRGALEWCREHAAVVSFTEDGILVEAADLKASGRTFLLAVKDAQRILMQRGGGK